MKKGFSFVELSIALVIIGLLIGGILAGQSLIDNVKLKRAMSELGQYQIMTKQFTEKFRYLPGDLSGYKYFGAACGGNYGSTNVNNGCNGNQNGTLTYGGENLLFWKHMQVAGYIDANLSQVWYPTVPAFIPGQNIIGAELFGKNAVYFPNSGGVDSFIMRISQPNTHNADQPIYPVVSGEMMVAMEKKYDDGIGTTGIITANSPYYTNAGYDFPCVASTTQYYYSINPSAYKNSGCIAYIGFIAY